MGVRRKTKTRRSLELVAVLTGALLVTIPALPARSQVVVSGDPDGEVSVPAETEVEVTEPVEKVEATEPPLGSLEDTLSATRASEDSEAEPAPCPSPLPEGDGALDCVSVQVLSPPVIAGATPKVSDTPNGVDETYELVAGVSHAPEEAVVEAFLTAAGSDNPLGPLTRRSPDTWELAWDIPSSLNNGGAQVSVVVRRGPEAGAQELFRDTVSVTLQHKETPAATPLHDPLPPAETAELTWPTQAGPLGFYKPRDGSWATVVSGILSSGADATFNVYYSDTPVGREPSFTQCGQGTAPLREEDGMRPFEAACTLAGSDLPSQVTAVAVVPQRNEQAATEATPSAKPQAADVARVAPFIQRAEDMAVSLRAIDPTTPSLSHPSGARRLAGGGCIEMAARVTDQFDSPVQGANVDVEVVGPTDAVAFGNLGANAAVPAGFAEEDASNCGGAAADSQALMVVPDGLDPKRLESAAGSGLGGEARGEWRFRIFSPENEWGVTTVYAWADGHPRASETATAEADNEIRDPSEPVATAEVQWLEAPVALSVAGPAVDAAPTDACDPYVITAAGGRALLAGVNVDLHIRGPKEPREDLHFCKPRGAVKLRAPDAGEHGTEEEPSTDTHPGDTTHCPQEGPSCLHREGETDRRGRLIFGLSSDSPGDTTITAWFDGEPNSELDDDLDNAPFTDAGLQLTTSWVDSATDAKIAFTNPSAYPGQREINSSTFRISLAANAPYLVKKGIAVALTNAEGQSVDLGVATSVGQSATYELVWDLDSSPLPGGAPPEDGDGDDGDDSGQEEEPAAGGAVPDGAYTLKAGIPGTSVAAEAAVTVDREADPPPSTQPPPEWAQITSPGNGHAASFTDGQVKVTGLLSPGAERVQLAYTLAPAGAALTAQSWRSCGPAIDVPGAGADPKPFESTCALAAGDASQQVTGLAAVALDCTSGNCALPTNVSLGTGPEAGDAVRINACVGSPCVVVSPTEWQAKKGSCQFVVAEVASFESGPVADADLEIGLKGPGKAPSFCRPSRSGRSFTGSTNQQGRLRFGVKSAKSSFGSIFSPIETGFTTITARLGDASDEAVMHWDLPGRCTVIGTKGDDELTASSFPDKICGLGGDDTINGLDGLEGHDIILGGPGDDVIDGARGNDLVKGGRGNDLIFGGPGDDRLFGGPGNDDIFGAEGKDRINGGGGRDGCSLGREGRDGIPARRCERRARGRS